MHPAKGSSNNSSASLCLGATLNLYVGNLYLWIAKNNSGAQGGYDFKYYHFIALSAGELFLLSRSTPSWPLPSDIN